MARHIQADDIKASSAQLKTAETRSYVPSDLVTTGRAFLLSLGEDILELAGDELLEGLVAAAIIRGDVVVVDVKDRLEGYFGPSTTLSSTLNQGRVARRGELLDS
jgi:hypothetical protein